MASRPVKTERSTTLLWFRRDLRLADHAALLGALDSASDMVPVYIHDPEALAPWAPGAASRWWQHHALTALAQDIAARGGRLIVRRGATLRVLQALVAETGATSLHWQRQYEPAAIARDKQVKAWATAQGIAAHSYPGGLLVEPWQVATGQGRPYRVFTPFHKTCRSLSVPPPQAAPTKLPAVRPEMDGLTIDHLRLTPTIPWDAGIATHWQPGEAGAGAALSTWTERVSSYGDHRDHPDLEGTSRLSPYLHHGELSPAQVLWACKPLGEAASPFIRQLYWREFAYHLLYHFPHTTEQPLDPRFADLTWSGGGDDLAAWQAGRTGIPIIDAGMRQLWHTGWMHNRVRMLVASLLSKNLLRPWQDGARWFWDTLVDADLANNSLGWQWTAGCGADAAPFFRIFNPVLQGRKFDPDGGYVRRWLPELAPLPDKWLHNPWEAPSNVLDGAGLAANSIYRNPIVDLRQSRQDALALWTQIKQAR